MNGDGSATLIARRSSLLQSKLRPPTVPAYFVSRPRLDARLDGIDRRPLMLVVAPAGSGKSQLISSWVSRCALPSAWLSIEEIDNDPAELWFGIIAALEQLAPGRAAAALDQLAARAPIDVVVRLLLHGLEADPAPVAVLVLDDVHTVKSDEAADSLAVFVQHLPVWLHVVMISRSDPRLPLDRLRVRGDLTELRFADLRFTPDEARSMLDQLAPALRDDALDQSVRDTDGWAAGIQLTALAARSTQTLAPRAPLGVQALTEDYVWHEVLSTGDPDVVEVLLQVSVIDRVNAALAAAITGRSDARELLLRAEAQGLFVCRLGSGGWFQIHGLVREVLRNELGRQGRHHDCHGRAARWLEEAGELPDALEQWLLADRPRDALRLVSGRSTELYNQGREAIVRRTIAAIPLETTADDLAALIEYAASLILVSRPRFLEAVRDAIWQHERSDQALAPQIAALRSIAATMIGDWTTAGASAVRALDGLGDAWLHDVAGRFAWNIVARSIALTERWDDDDQLVATAAIQMRREPGRGLSFEGIRALGYALAGRPIDALQVSGGIRHAAATMSILRGELDLAEAIARREIGDRERAVAELSMIADHPDEREFYRPAIALLELALAAVDTGDVGGAADHLRGAQTKLDNASAGADLSAWANRVATVVALALGDDDEARRRADDVDDAFWGPVSRARVHLACDDHDAARAALADATTRSVRHRVVLDLLLARSAPSGSATADHTTTAIKLASANGLMQTVVSDGRDLMDVIERTAWAAPEEWMQRLRLTIAMTSAVPAGALATFEPLTAREREVLRLLPSRLTLNEIARELYVSVNTLKFHLRVIYRKLGVNSRDEAAAIARSMTKVRARTS